MASERDGTQDDGQAFNFEQPTATYGIAGGIDEEAIMNVSDADQEWWVTRLDQFERKVWPMFERQGGYTKDGALLVFIQSHAKGNLATIEESVLEIQRMMREWLKGIADGGQDDGDEWKDEADTDDGKANA